MLVAGGALGTARLLHRSGIRPDALGRGISFHALLFGQVVLAADICPPAGEKDLAPRLWIPPTAACTLARAGAARHLSAAGRRSRR